MPLLKLQQLINQLVLGLAVQPVVVRYGVGAQGMSLLDQTVERIRVIAPALAQQVGKQGVADDAFGEWMAVRGLLPVRRQVPVIGDVVVVENHHARQMRHRPCHAAQAGGKRLDQLLFRGVALDFPVFQLRPAGFDQGPGRG